MNTPSTTHARNRFPIGLLGQALKATGLVVAGIALDRLALRYLFFFESLQWLLGPLNSLGHLLSVPGVVALRIIGVGEHLGQMPLLLILATNIPFYLTMFLLLLHVRAWIARREFALPMRPDLARKDALGPELRESERLTRRGFFQLTARRTVDAGATGCSVGLLGYGMLIAPRQIAIEELAVPIADLRPELDGLRLVHMSDLHLGPWLPVRHVRQAIGMANELNPDLIVLTGDFVHESPRFIPLIARELTRLRPGIATLGVLGNHDWWEDGPLCKRELAGANVRLLDNARCILDLNRRITEKAEQGLCMAGIGDLWTDQIDFAAALDGVPPQMPRLLLSHNPDMAENPELTTGGRRVDLMLSGHTHGGQIRLPFLGTPLVPSHYGQKYRAGLVQGPGCRVYVTRGVGLTVLPIRFGVPPEITVIILKAENA